MGTSGAVYGVLYVTQGNETFRQRDQTPEYLISRQLILLSEQKLPEMIKGGELPDICFYRDVTAYK